MFVNELKNKNKNKTRHLGFYKCNNVLYNLYKNSIYSTDYSRLIFLPTT